MYYNVLVLFCIRKTVDSRTRRSSNSVRSCGRASRCPARSKRPRCWRSLNRLITTTTAGPTRACAARPLAASVRVRRPRRQRLRLGARRAPAGRRTDTATTRPPGSCPSARARWTLCAIRPPTMTAPASLPRTCADLSSAATPVPGTVISHLILNYSR